MRTLQNISKRILAALSFFTRLPFWRICDIEADHYKHVVPLWPLAGWLTGGAMTLTVLLTSAAGLPAGISVALALASRMLLTGALHEDGFADFCDGFGGGTSRERVLEIMKDSHIGTYGVLGLVVLYLLQWNVLTALMQALPGGAMLFVVADPLCKMASSSIVHFLPYARKASEAKIKMVYTRPSWRENVACLAFGLLPAASFFSMSYILPFVMACVAALCLFAIMRRRIQGYTGDCCGASFIITETVFYLTLCLLQYAS